MLRLIVAPLHKIWVWTQIRKIKRKSLVRDSDWLKINLCLIFLICVQTHNFLQSAYFRGYALWIHQTQTKLCFHYIHSPLIIQGSFVVNTMIHITHNIKQYQALVTGKHMAHSMFGKAIKGTQVWIINFIYSLRILLQTILESNQSFQYDLHVHKCRQTNKHYMHAHTDTNTNGHTHTHTHTHTIQIQLILLFKTLFVIKAEEYINTTNPNQHVYTVFGWVHLPRFWVLRKGKGAIYPHTDWPTSIKGPHIQPRVLCMYCMIMVCFCWQIEN